ncbi:protein NO VEIN domain-containing protein [Lactococcus petauri]|uniref:protein NO VEIN domain-containing protein n=1 Tax=Lactococcus petauri TaxID=1940789 RepID=UPI0022E759E9|nr:DUF3883 domain-containing protein [Lactococcus petauri]
MTYNSDNQYRCTIIRGKAKNALDDLLPAYAQIINEITPIEKDIFKVQFNERLKRILPRISKKTLDNHRTEIAGKLFGLFYNENGVIYFSDRGKKFLEDGDQPSFFKEMCFKLQFPNGMDKIQTLQNNINNKVKIRPLCFVAKLLLEANECQIILNQNEIGYYVLNNLDVLQGIATAAEVIDKIISDRANSISKELDSGSRAKQHIREQLNYLELANLIKISGGDIYPNLLEKSLLLKFSEYSTHLSINPYEYNLSDDTSKIKFYHDWDIFYQSLTPNTDIDFTTSLSALEYKIPKEDTTSFNYPKKLNTVELGDEGEKLVYQYELDRVSEFNRRLTNKVHMFGKTKGLGYDIQSIFANESDNPEFVKYIEVKSTKRVTKPNFEEKEWQDVLNITRNEWVAAQQWGKSYEIYRVYFTQDGPMMIIIKNPFKKFEEEIISVFPVNYRLEFNGLSIDDRREFE